VCENHLNRLEAVVYAFWLSPLKKQGIGPPEENAVMTLSLNQTASVIWEGKLGEGSGTLSTESGVLFNANISMTAHLDT
jgi:hypothetical protein